MKASVIADPAKGSVGLLLDVPRVARVEVEFGGGAELSVKFGGVDEKAHLGVDAEGTGVEVAAADEDVVVVDDNGFGVETESAISGGAVHVSGAVFAVGAEFVEIGTVVDETVEVSPVGSVGGSVVVGAEGVGENADLNTTVFGALDGRFEFRGGDEVGRDEDDFVLGVVEDLADVVRDLDGSLVAFGWVLVGWAINEETRFSGDGGLAG